MPDISSPPERTEELVEQVRSAIWCEIEKQTGGNWPVELGNGDLVDATLDLTALSRAALQSLGYAEMERERARLLAALRKVSDRCWLADEGNWQSDILSIVAPILDAEIDRRTALRGDREQGEG